MSDGVDIFTAVEGAEDASCVCRCAEGHVHNSGTFKDEILVGRLWELLEKVLILQTAIQPIMKNDKNLSCTVTLYPFCFQLSFSNKQQPWPRSLSPHNDCI